MSKESVIMHDSWLQCLYLSHIQFACKKAPLVWRVKINFISNKSLNNGTFSRFKCFLMPFRTRDRKIQNFLSWNLQKNQSSQMKRLLPLLQFACKNWISTSASINAQLRYSFGTTLFYVNLPCLRMVLVKLEDVSLGPEPCTLLFLHCKFIAWRGLNSALDLGPAVGKFRGFQWQH